MAAPALINVREKKATEILAEPPTFHIPADIDQQLREAFDIRLSPPMA